MTDENKGRKARIKIDDLPQAEQELSPEEASEVKGGLASIQDQTARSQEGEEANPHSGVANMFSKM